MVAQTRLDIEAEHLRRFRWNFGGKGWRDVLFPRVLLGTRAVLVESFEPGVLVSKYTIEHNLGVAGGEALDRRTAHFVVSRGEDTYLKMLLADNLMHADLHPGNILLHAPRARRPQLVMLDLGMVARLKPEESQAFIGFLHAVGAGDGALAGRRVLAFSDDQTCTAPEAFCADMHAFFLESCRGYGTGVDFGEVRASSRSPHAPRRPDTTQPRKRDHGADSPEPGREPCASAHARMPGMPPRLRPSPPVPSPPPSVLRCCAACSGLCARTAWRSMQTT